MLARYTYIQKRHHRFQFYRSRSMTVSIGLYCSTVILTCGPCCEQLISKSISRQLVMIHLKLREIETKYDKNEHQRFGKDVIPFLSCSDGVCICLFAFRFDFRPPSVFPSNLKVFSFDQLCILFSNLCGNPSALQSELISELLFILPIGGD